MKKIRAVELTAGNRISIDKKLVQIYSVVIDHFVRVYDEKNQLIRQYYPYHVVTIAK